MGLPIIPNRFSAHFQPVRPSLPNGPSTIHMHSEQHEKRPESASKPPSCGFEKRLSHSFQTISRRKTSNSQVSPTFFPETTHSTCTAIATHCPTDRKSPFKRSKSIKSAVSSKKHRSRRLKKGRWKPLPVRKRHVCGETDRQIHHTIYPTPNRRSGQQASSVTPPSRRMVPFRPNGALRCISHRSAVHRPLQRAAMSFAAQCV